MAVTVGVDLCARASVFHPLADMLCCCWIKQSVLHGSSRTTLLFKLLYTTGGSVCLVLLSVRHSYGAESIVRGSTRVSTM